MGGPTSLIGAGVALAACLLCYEVIMLATRPRRRVASGGGIGSGQPAGLPPPALAGLLYRADGRVPRSAPVATVLDLVARRIVTVSFDAEGRPWYGVTGSAGVDVGP